MVRRSRSRLPILLLGLAIALALPAVVACGDDDGGGGSGGRFAAILRDIPAGASKAGQLILADVTRAPSGPVANATPVEGQTRATLGDPIADAIQARIGLPEVLGYPGPFLIRGCETLATVKLPCGSITAAVWVPDDSGRMLYDLAYGAFKANDVVGAFACDTCPPARKHAYQGFDYYTWTDDPAAPAPEKRVSPPSFDSLGRAGVLALRDGVASRTLSVAAMEALLRVRAGEESLAANDAYLSVAKALDANGAANAFITPRGQTLASVEQAFGVTDPQKKAEIEPLARGKTVLRPYQVMAIGQGAKDGETFLVIALYHASAADATENAKRAKARIAGESSLRTMRPWSALFTSVETRSSGRVTEIVLRGPGVASWYAFWAQGDPLLLYDE